MDETNGNIIELIDEKGEAMQFELEMNISYEDSEYVVLKVLDTESIDEDEVIILRVETDENGDDVYEIIEDDQEQQEVFEAYLEILDSEELETQDNQ